MRGTAAAADFVGDLVEVFLGPCDQHHLAAGFRDFLRGRRADARRPARDEDDLALDGIVQRAALHRIQQIPQVERSISAGRVRGVDEVRHRGERLFHQVREGFSTKFVKSPRFIGFRS